MSDKEGPLDVVTCEQRSAGRVMQIFRGEQSKIGEWDMQRPWGRIMNGIYEDQEESLCGWSLVSVGKE